MTDRRRKGRVLQGDCLELLKRQRTSSVDLIIPSPPYADNRRTTYTGVKASDYVDWFLPIAKQLKRVLKDDGSFILNIKERVAQGERGTYVLELILALRKRDGFGPKNSFGTRRMPTQVSGQIGFATRGTLLALHQAAKI